jgi:hypothetical protein
MVPFVGRTLKQLIHIARDDFRIKKRLAMHKR